MYLPFSGSECTLLLVGIDRLSRSAVARISILTVAEILVMSSENRWGKRHRDVHFYRSFPSHSPDLLRVWKSDTERGGDVSLLSFSLHFALLTCSSLHLPPLAARSLPNHPYRLASSLSLHLALLHFHPAESTRPIPIKGHQGGAIFNIVASYPPLLPPHFSVISPSTGAPNFSRRKREREGGLSTNGWSNPPHSSSLISSALPSFPTHLPDRVSNHSHPSDIFWYLDHLSLCPGSK